MLKYIFRLMGLLCLLLTYVTKGQQIQIDRGVRVNNLWCFPLLSDSLTYLYLPDEASLALDKNDAVKLQDPVIFLAGNYALISSILNPNTGNAERNLLAMGQAPVLEGSRLALSFELTPEQSKLLLESFKMQTPDISLVAEPLHLAYGFRQDHNQTEWLSYQVQNIWQFQGGYGTYASEWTDQSSAMINLYVPYERRKIQLSGDMEAWQANGVKAVVAQVFYEFFGEKRKLQQVLRPGHTPEDFELIMPLDQYEYDYVMIWIKEDGTLVEKKGKNSLGLLFYDELPENSLTISN